MKLLVVLICIGIQRFLNIRFSLSELDWFKPYRALIQKTLGQSLMKGYVGLAIVVLPVAVLVWILDAILGGNPIFGLVIGVAVVFFCLDSRDISKQISNYLSGGKAEKGKSSDEELKDLLKESVPTSPAERARAVSSKVVIISLHHVFSVLFWYMLFGLFGVVVYFLVHRLTHEGAKPGSDAADYLEAAKLVQGIMAWVPVRLVGLSFGAVGNFGAALNQLMKNLVGGLDVEQKLPVTLGLAAANADIENASNATVEENKSILDIVFKAEIVWIVAIAVLTLISLI
ncbi:MAG: regulatory signaling modulator protein AmpE [Gammaproteobacteria bacterium]|nr:regulatory signaling modulator protein AmpE [Gammaproteobacteria bacterium]